MGALKKQIPSDVVLPRYDDMCRAIAECHRVDEVKDIRDKAEALRAYAKQANNREVECQFAECKVRAEIKCGELLRDMAQLGERAGVGRRHANSDNVSLVSDMGITAKDSERFQRASEAPPELVEAAFTDARATLVPVTSSQIRNLTRSPDFSPQQRTDHERLWRVLRALEQISDQDIAPSEWLDALPPYMHERVANHIQRARPWLMELFEEWRNRYEHD